MDEIAKKTLALPVAMWARIADYRFRNRVPSEAEAIRRLLADALDRAEGGGQGDGAPP